MRLSLAIKLGIVVLAATVFGSTLIYTRSLVREIQKNERGKVTLLARAYETAYQELEGSDYSFILEEIIGGVDFPIIQTDRQHNLLTPLAAYSRNAVDTSLPPAEQRKRLESLLESVDADHPPIPIRYVTGGDTLILNYIHYGDSPLIRRVNLFPFIAFGSATLIIVIGYVAFLYISRSESSRLWAGLAKETAHQLGTPLSSMLGWLELGKSDPTASTVKDRALNEISHDVARLQKVAARFSKIGSTVELRDENVLDIITHTVDYFQRRTERAGLKVVLNVECAEPVMHAKVNRDLFEWVIENLTKNAIDAMEDQGGSVTYVVSGDEKNVTIDVRDTGKGIDARDRKEVFRAGFSTKRRGWGLGLTLARRIIVQNHKGKIFVKDSAPGKGTTFRIILSR